jgi:hypothetical protein
MSSPGFSHNSFTSEANDQWDPCEEPLADDLFDESSQRETQTNELKFCQFTEWDSKRTYDDSYIRYSAEYKITVNNRAIMPKDTEQGIVLAPAAYWEFLKPKLEDSVRKTNRTLKSAFTSVIVSVTQRKEPDYTKRFDNTWADIESQLIKWSKFYRAGKTFKLSLSFNYRHIKYRITERG